MNNLNFKFYLAVLSAAMAFSAAGPVSCKAGTLDQAMQLDYGSDDAYLQARRVMDGSRQDFSGPSLVAADSADFAESPKNEITFSTAPPADTTPMPKPIFKPAPPPTFSSQLKEFIGNSIETVKPLLAYAGAGALTAYFLTGLVFSPAAIGIGAAIGVGLALLYL
ncbi:MAG: hypothetical protein ABIG11_07870 [bacterium]